MKHRTERLKLLAEGTGYLGLLGMMIGIYLNLKLFAFISFYLAIICLIITITLYYCLYTFKPLFRN